MATGEPKIVYYVITKKCEEGKAPVIGGCNIGKEKYDIIQGIIHGRHGTIIKDDGTKMNHRKGGKK